MPIIKSAKKRVRVAAKASARNSRTKRNVKEAIKAFYSALSADKPAKIEEAHKQAVSAIDIAAKKHVIHKNKAARKKQQLHTAMKKTGVKLRTAKKTTAKTTKPVAKKAPAKKTPAKKSPAKKTPAKK